MHCSICELVADAILWAVVGRPPPPPPPNVNTIPLYVSFVGGPFRW